MRSFRLKNGLEVLEISTNAKEIIEMDEEITFTIALIDQDGELEELNDFSVVSIKDAERLTHPLQALEFAEWISGAVKTWMEDNGYESD